MTVIPLNLVSGTCTFYLNYAFFALHQSGTALAFLSGALPLKKSPGSAAVKIQMCNHVTMVVYNVGG